MRKKMKKLKNILLTFLILVSSIVIPNPVAAILPTVPSNTATSFTFSPNAMIASSEHNQNNTDLKTGVNEIKQYLRDLQTNIIDRVGDNTITGSNIFNTGTLTFGNGFIFSAGKGFNSTLLRLDAANTGVASSAIGVEVNRGSTSANKPSVIWKEANTDWQCTTDGTVLANLEVAPGTLSTHAVRFDQALLTTGNQTKTSGTLIFNVAPQSTVDPSVVNDLGRKGYIDNQIATINAGSCVSQASAPACTMVGQCWFDTGTDGTTARPVFKECDGVTWRNATGTFYQSTTPTDTAAGRVWLDTTNKLLKVGNGSSYDIYSTPATGNYGDGSDGAVTINSGSFSSGPITNNALTRDAYFTNLTLSGGNLNTAGFRLFCSGTLTINSTFSVNQNGNAGTNAVGPTNGVGGAATAGGYFPAGVAGGDGGIAGGTPDGAGGAGMAGSNTINSVGSNAAVSGAGGTGDSAMGASGAAGVAGTVSALAAAAGGMRHIGNAILWRAFNGITVIQPTVSASPGGGGGGGGGTAGGTGSAGAGGGAGSPGGIVPVSAKNLVNNATCGLSSQGGNGGNGGNSIPGISVNSGGGGGGPGGNGGWVTSIADTRSGSGTVCVNGGAFGLGGTGDGTGTAGGNGAPGIAGTAIAF